MPKKREPEVLPPEEKALSLNSLSRQNKKWVAMLGAGTIIGGILWCINEFTSIRGVNSVLISRIILTILWVLLVLLAVVVLWGLTIRWRRRLFVVWAIVAAALLIEVDRIAPKPAEPVAVPDEVFLDAYAMRSNYPSGTEIGQIPWDNRFTDLRVVVTNRSDEYLQNMDLEVWTDTAVDQWLYKAAILDGPQGCDLKVNEGGSVIKETAPIYHDVGKNPDTITATRVGHGFDFHDTMGNTMSTVLTNGYRLFCSSFPSNTSIQLVFAVVSVQSRYLPSEAPAPGTWKMGVVPAGVDLIDQLDKRPFPPAVKIYKNYVRALRKFSSDAVIVRVRNGD